MRSGLRLHSIYYPEWKQGYESRDPSNLVLGLTVRLLRPTNCHMHSFQRTDK